MPRHVWTDAPPSNILNVDGWMRGMVLSHPLTKEAGERPNLPRRTLK